MKHLINAHWWMLLVLSLLPAQAQTTCNYSISPGSRSHGYSAASNSISVSSGVGCAWNVVNTNSWITILSAPSSSGTGVVSYAVAANTNYSGRTGTLVIASQTFIIQQASAPCNFSLSPTTRTHGHGFASNAVTVTAAGPCSWSVINTSAWINLAGVTSGVGTGIVSYTVAPNNMPQQRTGSVVIADETFVLIQNAAPCIYELSPSNRVHGYAGSTGAVSVSTAASCFWMVRNTNSWISITANPSGTGVGTFGYTVAPNPASAPRSGIFTVWDQVFTVYQHPAPCNFQITPSSTSAGAEAETNQVTINTAEGCGWLVSSAHDWISVSPMSGNGPAVVSVIAAGNASSTGRTGTVSIAGQTFTVRQAGAVCTYRLSPTNRVHGYGSATNTVSINTLSVCGWSVVNTNTWISFSTTPAGTGPAMLTYSIEANMTTLERTGTVWVAGQPFTVIQRSIGCALGVSPSGRSHGHGSASNIVTVTVANGCDWIASTTNAWISLAAPTSGSGNGVIGYTLPANPTAAPRIGAISINDTLVVLTQAPAPCTFALLPANARHTPAQETGTVAVASPDGCGWAVINTNAWINILGGASGNGSGTLTYRVTENSGANARSGALTIGGQAFLVTQDALTCSYKLSTTSRTHGWAATTNSFTMTASNTCAWFVVNTNNWLTILSGASGSGPGTITYSITANGDTPLDRTGALTIGDQRLTLTQHGIPCHYAITPSTRTHGYAAATNFFSLTTTNGCTWSVGNTNAWISIAGATNGSTSTTLAYVIEPNTNLTDRIGVLTVGAQTFTVTQRAAICTFEISPAVRNHGYGASTGAVTVLSYPGCTWTLINTNAWISITSGMSGDGEGIVTYSIAANPVLTGRSGTITVAGQPLVINQSAYDCSYKLSPTNRVHGFASTTGSVTITTGPNCSWNIVNTNEWINIVSPLSGAGDASFTYTVSANFGFASRTGYIVVSDALLAMTQQPAGDAFSFDVFRVNDNGSVTFRMAGGPPGIWELQTSTDLKTWTKVGEATNSTGRVERSLPLPTGSQRFYRAVLP